MHVHHAFDNVCNGSMYYDEAVDSVVWSTGDVGLELTNLLPGTYGFQAYLNGAVVNEGERVVEQNGWDVQVSSHPIFSGIQLSGQVSVAHCQTSIFNNSCCIPDPATTELRVLQDGLPFSIPQCMGCTDVQCAFTPFQIEGLPYGHAYQLMVVDPVCAGDVLLPAGPIIAHSCAELEVVTDVTPASAGEANGSITFLEAIPDPTEPYPISAPVVGTATLRHVNTMEVVAAYEHVGTAVWSDLAAGEYLLTYSPDEGCQLYSAIVQVGAGTTGIQEDRASSLRVFPTITEGTLQLVAPGQGPVEVRICDVQGLELFRQHVAPGMIDVTALPVGTYLATMQQGTTVQRTRFIKR